MAAMRWLVRLAWVSTVGAVLVAQPSLPDDTTAPATLDAFKAEAARIVAEAGLPGAGLALVGVGGVEWAGGVGVADRATRRPVDGDTLFRVGSISKTFVAMALVQLYEEGRLDLDATVASVLPDVRFDNRWDATDPVRIRHLLEHTAGIDDMHFNEIYARDQTMDRPLTEILANGPATRLVRWRPGTRMSYANPGYAVAARIVEVVTNTPFDQYILEHVFAPLEMKTSTFSGDLRGTTTAEGYESPTGPPVARRRIQLRPAGALQSSARELGYFVEMLLNWGERRTSYVVDPEYLSNMEWPRTTAAATAGVRAGYGLGIDSTIDLPYHVLGHDGAIDGFLSTYGYSPSRDVGFVVLVNGSYAPDAIAKLSSLALRYLKRDVAPTPPETMPVPVTIESLQRFEGYYHDASPRQALLEAFTFPTAGRVVQVDDGALVMTPIGGPAARLVPVHEGVFRREHELVASLAFTTVDGQPVLTGAGVFAEKRSRWPLAFLRGGLFTALALALLAPLAAAYAAWPRRRGPAIDRRVTITWVAASVVLATTAWTASATPVVDWATPSARAMTVTAGTVIYPLLAAVLVLQTLWHVRGWSALALASAIALSHVALAAYLGWWGLIGFRSWSY